jgi:1-deoxy-D-xylulose-5-phosphate reductoisomerase
MKKTISILGSTGSIGTTTLNIVEKKKNFLRVNILSANSNYIRICNQIIKFNPKIYIILNKKILLKVRKKFKNKKIKLINSYEELNNKNIKSDITVVAIPGIAGLEPTIFFIKKSKKVLLANKESIICGWNIINKIAKKNNTIIIPIDSEHFSIKTLLHNHSFSEIKKIYITASGGPFLNLPNNKFAKIKPSDAIKHPKWKMGKKISIDSATLMNKILELIEAVKIFSLPLNKFKIIVHPQSLVHAIVEFKNGLIKLLYHEPDMTIPISNALFDFKSNINNYTSTLKRKNIIENLVFKEVDKKKFPVIRLIPKLNNYFSTPIIINGANEIFVDQFLEKKISFNSIIQYLYLVLKDKNYKKYAIQRSNNLKNIYMIDKWSRATALKIIERKSK